MALLAPVDASTMSPDFTPARLLAAEAGPTYCTITPVVPTVLALYHPRVNQAVLKVKSSVGIPFGAVNLVMWFILEPWGWWTGVLHIPLAVISVYAFALARSRTSGLATSAAAVAPR